MRGLLRLVLFVSCVTGASLLLRNEIIQYQQLLLSKENLEAHHTISNIRNKQTKLYFNTLDQVLLLLEMNNMKLKTLKYQGPNQYVLSFEENYIRMHRLLVTLRKNKVPVKITKIYMRMNPHHFLMTTITVEILDPYSPEYSASLLKGNIIDPFCSVIPETQASNFSIYQILFIGVTKQDQRLAAILKVPNGNNIIIKPGDEIGNEKAKLIKIDNQQVDFILPNKKHIVLNN